MLLIPVEATFNVIKNDYIPGICRDNPLGEPAQYQTRTVDQFVRSTGSPIRIPSLPPRKSLFPGFWQGGMGKSYIVGEAVVPSLKADGGFRRPKPKSPTTRKEFEQLKKEGRIVVSEVSLGNITVQDVVIPIDGTPLGEYSHSLEVSSSSLFTALAPCGPYSTYYATTREGHGVTVNNLALLTPESVGTYSVTGTYKQFRSTGLTTLMTKHAGIIQQAATLIESQLLSVPVSSGLVTSAAAELNESAYDLLTELGELPETVNMIYSALKKIITYYLETKRKVDILKRSKRSQEPIALLDEIASIWMAYRYGIMPIVYSINDALDYLEMKGTLFRTVRKGQNHNIDLDIPGWTFSRMNVREHVWAKGRFEASAGNGLGFNGAVTAWELMPLSFVLDWVFNVGDLISALVPSIKFDDKCFSRSTRCQTTLTGSHPDIPIPVQFDVDLYDRRIINPLVHVGLNFNVVMTLKRQLDALALSWFAFVKMTTPRR